MPVGPWRNKLDGFKVSVQGNLSARKPVEGCFDFRVQPGFMAGRRAAAKQSLLGSAPLSQLRQHWLLPAPPAAVSISRNILLQT